MREGPAEDKALEVVESSGIYKGPLQVAGGSGAHIALVAIAVPRASSHSPFVLTGPAAPPPPAAHQSNGTLVVMHSTVLYCIDNLQQFAKLHLHCTNFFLSHTRQCQTDSAQSAVQWSVSGEQEESINYC